MLFRSAGVDKKTTDNLLYRRVLFLDNAMYGDAKTLEDYINDLSLRVFYPIKKVNFKVVSSSDIIMPLAYIIVNDQKFRVVSVKRDFSAETNDFSQAIDGEWLGGK